MELQQTSRPQLEQLEEREVPATFGIPWLDPTRLTVSFGTNTATVGTQTNQLNATLGENYTTTQWQTELLKAIQTWVSQANLNVGLVSDNGSAFGSTATAQGTPGVGDLRFGAVALSSNEVAQSLPYSTVYGSWSGDILFNSNYNFGSGSYGTYNLYTVALQEVGHALSLPNCPNSSSVLYDQYNGTHTGLTSADVTTIQTLYGTRQADAYDRVQSNSSTYRATDLTNLLTSTENTSSWGWSSNYGSSSTSARGALITADITNSTDVDYYKFTAPTSGTTTVTLRTNGISLLTGELAIYDSQNNQLARISNTDPLRTTPLTLSLNMSAGQTYYVRVRATTGTYFNVGAYQLQIQPPNTTAPTTASMVTQESFLNTSIQSATELKSPTAWGYTGAGMLHYAGDSDYYRFKPTSEMAGPGTLSLSVVATSGAGVAPQVELYDANNQRIAGKVVVNEKGAFVLHVSGDWKVGQTYYVRVFNNSNATSGLYAIGVNFQPEVSVFTTISQGTLIQSKPQAGQTLTVAQSELYHFILSGTSAQTNAGVRLTLKNSAGAVVGSFMARAGETVSTNLWLPAGTYTVIFSGGTSDGTALQNLNFNLQVRDASDSIDPYAIEPSNPGSSSAPPAPPAAPVDYWYSPLWIEVLLTPTDPYSRPFWY